MTAPEMRRLLAELLLAQERQAHRLHWSRRAPRQAEAHRGHDKR